MGHKISDTTRQLPVRTDAQRIIAQKQAALAEAERALTTARETYNEEGVVEAQARIRALQDILGSLEIRHSEELEVAARERASRWIEVQDLDGIVGEIASRQQKAEICIEATIQAIASEMQARRRWTHARGGIEVLTARWPELRAQVPSATTTPPLPGDYAGRIEAQSNIREVGNRPLIVPGRVTASSTEADRRRATLRALYTVLHRKRAAVPEDVLAILAIAPKPSELDETPVERDRRERREARDRSTTEQFDQAVDETTRVIDAIPGSVVGL